MSLSLGDKMGDFESVTALVQSAGFESVKALLQSTSLDLFNHFRDVEYRDLEGREITLNQAIEKYEVPAGTLRGWVTRGDLKPLRPGIIGGISAPAIFNERDVAARIALYKVRPNAKLKTLLAKTA